MSLAPARSQPVSPSADRQIRVEVDESDEAMGAFLFHKGRSGKTFIWVGNIHVSTRPVIKYFSDYTEISVLTNFDEDFSDRLRRSVGGYAYYLVFDVKPDWSYSARRCRLTLSEERDPRIFQTFNRDGSFEWASRFVHAEMEKAKSAFMARGVCRPAKPWMGHKGMYE